MMDMTTEEQQNVRRALRCLRIRCGGWATLAKALGLQAKTVKNIGLGQPVSAGLTLRLARMVRVPVDDLLSGQYPRPGACPHCGNTPASTGPTTTILTAR